MVSTLYTAPHLTLAPSHLYVQKAPHVDPNSPTGQRHSGALAPSPARLMPGKGKPPVAPPTSTASPPK
jgi:hypothetical protein